MNAIPLVRANVVLPVVKFLDQIRAPTEQFLRQSGLSVEALDHPEALIPLYCGFTFLETAARSEGIEHLGVLVSQQVQIADLGLFGKILSQSLTLYDLLHTVSALLTTTYNSGARAWITQQDDRIWFNHQFINHADLNNQQAQYFACLLYLKIIQLVVGTDWHPTDLHFQTSKLHGLEKIEAFFQSRVHFNQPNNAIGFHKSLLHLPLQRQVNDCLSFSQQEQVYENVQSSAPAPDFSGSLRQLIRSQLSSGEPDVALAAAAAGLSIRSFQRQLTEAGLSYSHLVDQVRFELAMAWLKDPSIQIVDIALNLGYTNPANFTRAFKRWAGITPRTFRHSAMQ
ncbi:MAG TPA: AraC family transcriptional regulator ligand-binding domain-containing protein [Leptolyngbyaceae cyanobacterium M33_DOE_097]|uniref:AraC family transcriptional regulator n=1 Tax=Oscillatoriales cyanobacterium SpSt-418 TaxID=2282169 RepID=A0A7C3KHC9_9CYAN|nr:AraC family transcriptional regulator ligand-binding domain-containing protein [Leptolyngbyaceae cyanobacterium M33_DOE_097]